MLPSGPGRGSKHERALICIAPNETRGLVVPMIGLTCKRSIGRPLSVRGEVPAKRQDSVLAPQPMNSHADPYLQATLSAAGLVARKAFMSRIGGCPNIRLYSRLNWLTLSYPTSNAAPVASNPSMSIRCLAV